MKANVAFILAFVAVGTIADPETVEGLLKKKNVNSWQERQEQQQQQQVPIVAKKPNENQLTKVVGGYPQFTPDTLARPLKTTHGNIYFLPMKRSSKLFLLLNRSKPSIRSIFASSHPTMARRKRKKLNYEARTNNGEACSKIIRILCNNY